MIIALRTDQPEAEIAVCNEHQVLERVSWSAHRQLAETLHVKLDDLRRRNISKQGITGIIVYQGPGSFTGLRIGISVANALASTHTAPIVGVTGDNWITKGLSLLAAGTNQQLVMPDYGAPAHITTQKK